MLFYILQKYFYTHALEKRK